MLLRIKHELDRASGDFFLLGLNGMVVADQMIKMFSLFFLFKYACQEKKRSPFTSFLN